MTLLPYDDYAITPWRNGGGVTREIARGTASGEGADGDFAWRLSMATVAADGPFSRFPGIERTLSIVDGDGVVLVVDGRELHATRAGDPVVFDGGAATTSRLLGAEVTDLNVMVRRGAARARVRRIAMPDGHAESAVERGHEAFVVALGDGLEVTCPDEAPVRLGRRDTVRLRPVSDEPDGCSALLSAAGHGEALWVDLITH